MATREESVKIVRRGDEPVVCFIQTNSGVKLYKLVEVAYKDIDELFEERA